MIKANPSQVQQQEAVLHVNTTLGQYKDLLGPYHNRLFNVYKELSTFTYPKKADRSTTFKVNKMHEVSNKILPRIVGRDPKWIVNINPKMMSNADEVKADELQLQGKAIRDLLTTAFEKYNLQEPARIWAKGMVNYGPGYAKVKKKYVISRKLEKVDKEETYLDDNGMEQVRKIDKEIKEKVTDEYVTMEPVSWTDVFYDPRYVLFSDCPAVIQPVTSVRLSELKANKDDYINIDKLEEIVNIKKDAGNYKEQIQNITGLQLVDTPTIDKNNLTIIKYYGLYDLTGTEKLYEIGIANGLICICFEEISQIPFEQIRCFEDTETNLSTGFLEPILGLQQELNYKKNSASEYINHSLNRSYIWSANSGVNPKSLISKPNNIITTTKSVEQAMANLQEIPHREINSSFFQEQNDMERQIQGLTFTIDTNNSNNQQGLTNTATGMRIKFFESNTVIDEIRKHYEKGLERFAYKYLTAVAEDLDENITIKQIDGDGYWEINREAIIDALDKYEITVEAGSSSFDSIDNMREDAMAKISIGQQLMGAGVQVKMDELGKDALGTFEGTDPKKYITSVVSVPGITPIGGGGGGIPMPEQTLSGPAQTVQDVAQGNITSGL